MADTRSRRRVRSVRTDNHLLTALPKAERGWLQTRCTRVRLRMKQVLYNQGDTIDRLYFPVSGAVSLVSVMPDGRSAETAIVGTEGVIGVHVVYGIDVMPCDAIVQGAGEAWVLPVRHIWEDSPPDAHLRALLCGYAHALLLQTMQGAACNKLHSIQQRAARWILTLQDRLGSDAFPLTQELLGIMLGVRRQSVNGVARGLQRAKAIDYRHGQVVIKDRPKLEAVACGCYLIIRSQFAALLNGKPGGHGGCPCTGHQGRVSSATDLSSTGQIETGHV